MLLSKLNCFPHQGSIIGTDFWHKEQSDRASCGREEDGEVVGFNVGVNVGDTAWQTIFHCHILLIPQRKRDVNNPRGDVRHIMPGKGDYRENNRPSPFWTCHTLYRDTAKMFS